MLCLEQPPLGTGEPSFEIDRLKPIGPIFNRRAVRLGGLLVRTKGRLTDVSRVKLEPRLPGSVDSLLAANPHDVSSVAIDDLGRVFADKYGVDLRRLDVAGAVVDRRNLLEKVQRNHS